MKRPWALPLVPLYAAAAGLRSAGLRLGLEQVRRLARPVISVGNLSAGGTGKTPLVIALAELLKREGLSVDVLSRGYGRPGRSVEQVDADGSAERFGDEPLLIARESGVPVYVATRRFEAGRLAEASGAQAGVHVAGVHWAGVHLLDDGFQHRQLCRDVDLVLVNSEDLRDWLLPAGNLREPVGALRRADVFAVAEEDHAAVRRLRELGLTQPVWRFRRKMLVPEAVSEIGKTAGRVVAFCGIARPGQFFTGLEAAGVSIAARHVFADHHRFGAADMKLLGELTVKSGAAALVTTGKDRVRLAAMAGQLGVPVHAVGLRVVLQDEAGAMAWLREPLRRALSRDSSQEP